MIYWYEYWINFVSSSRVEVLIAQELSLLGFVSLIPGVLEMFNKCLWNELKNIYFSNINWKRNYKSLNTYIDFSKYIKCYVI